MKFGDYIKIIDRTGKEDDRGLSIPQKESALESYFCKQVKEAGGWAIKGDSRSLPGIPDRIVFYRGYTWLVELKMPGRYPTAVQRHIHERFERLEFKVEVIRTKEEVHQFTDRMKNIQF